METGNGETESVAQHAAGRIDRLIAAGNRCLGAIIAGGLVLVLPLSLLLFLQWPLRELVQSYSREANDLAQCLFALYASLAISYATRQHSHLAVDAWARHYAPIKRARLARIGALCALLPWSLFILVTGWPQVAASLIGLEKFPDTFNPGYFLIKAASWLLALLVALQALVDLLRSDAAERP